MMKKQKKNVKDIFISMLNIDNFNFQFFISFTNFIISKTFYHLCLFLITSVVLLKCRWEAQLQHSNHYITLKFSELSK
jgi:hypothetical protein